MIDGAFYAGIAAELIAKLRRLATFTKHSGAIGAHHEEIVKEALRPLLSQRFSLRTGFVFGKDQEVSSQGDIIIVDEHDPSPYFFQMGNLVVVHPRAVACVIEVKTRLTHESFQEALLNLRSFCDVGLRAQPPARFDRIIFAFEGSKLTAETLHNWFVDLKLADDVWSYPQLIYVLREGTLHVQPVKPDKSCAYRFLMGEEADEFKSRGLSIFLQTVRKSLEIKAGVSSNPFDYADLRELRWSAQHIRIGKGVIEDTSSNDVNLKSSSRRLFS
jgi:hypothetical protein